MEVEEVRVPGLSQMGYQEAAGSKLKMEWRGREMEWGKERKRT